MDDMIVYLGIPHTSRRPLDERVFHSTKTVNCDNFLEAECPVQLGPSLG